MHSGVKRLFKNCRLEYRNSRGKRVKGKYIVIESDDWGSIRQSSIEAWKEQLDRNPQMEEDPFFFFDSFECCQDLERLFDILVKYKDENGNHPVITADYAMANPDFIKIKESQLQRYFYEPITETVKSYSGCDQYFPLCFQGIDSGLWKPQLHCREHLQVDKWMRALRNRDPEIEWAFNHKMISTAKTIAKNNHYAYMDAFNYSENDESILSEIVEEATNLFVNMFGFRSRTFVASCYVWNNILEEILQKNGISCMQGGWYQWIPLVGEKGEFEKKTHYNGYKSDKQIYLVRNCLFEHSLFGDDRCVEDCLQQIGCAFRWHQPAIICSHRVNYMSRINASNGENGIRLLDELLKEIMLRWPDVKFISSDTLASIYCGEE